MNPTCVAGLLAALSIFLLSHAAVGESVRGAPSPKTSEPSYYGNPGMRKKVKPSQKQRVRARISGASSAARGRFPYMVSLRGPLNRHNCGGVLIARNWVLTAAHCVHPKRRNSVGLNAVVVIGGYNHDDDASVEGVEMIRVAMTFIHEDFDPDDLFGSGTDIALLKLEEPSAKTPIGLPDPRSQKGLGDRLLIIGWGSQGGESRVSALQQAFLSFIPKDICGEKWGGTIHPSMICAFDSKADACTGDSGGPILVPFAPDNDIDRGTAKFDTLIGLTSFGDDSACGESDRPGVYTDLSKFVGWVKETMGGHEGCPGAEKVDMDKSAKKEKKAKKVTKAKKSSPPVEDIPDVDTAPAPEVIDDKEFEAAVAESEEQSKKEKKETLFPERRDKEQEKLDSDLVLAAKVLDMKEAKSLLKKGANVNVDMNGWTPLLVAAHEGSIPMAQMFLKSGADIDGRGMNGWTPLIRASFDGHSDMVKFLHEAGADVDAQTFDGNTALMHASFRGRLEDIEVLLELGANKRVVNKNGSQANEVICGDLDVECPLSTRKKIESLLLDQD